MGRSRRKQRVPDRDRSCVARRSRPQRLRQVRGHPALVRCGPARPGMGQGAPLETWRHVAAALALFRQVLLYRRLGRSGHWLEGVESWVQRLGNLRSEITEPTSPLIGSGPRCPGIRVPNTSGTGSGRAAAKKLAAAEPMPDAPGTAGACTWASAAAAGGKATPASPRPMPRSPPGSGRSNPPGAGDVDSGPIAVSAGSRRCWSVPVAVSAGSRRCWSGPVAVSAGSRRCW